MLVVWSWGALKGTGLSFKFQGFVGFFVYTFLQTVLSCLALEQVSQNTLGKMELFWADAFSPLLHPMMLSRQKGNMCKIQLTDTRIQHVWLCLVLKDFHVFWFFRFSNTFFSLRSCTLQVLEKCKLNYRNNHMLLLFIFLITKHIANIVIICNRNRDISWCSYTQVAWLLT